MKGAVKAGTTGLGRRKTAVARVFIKPGSGAIVINNLPLNDYFTRPTSRIIVCQPLKLLDSLEKFDIRVNVKGGGKAGQAGAVRHAIARALVKLDIENRKPIKAEGYLTRDAREVERKKYGRHKARKRPQYSKR